MQVRNALCALALATTLAAGACGSNEGGERDAQVRKAEETAVALRASGPMPDEAFRADITVAQPPVKMRPNQKETLLVKVRNTGNAPWPSQGRPQDGYYQVNLGNTWYDSKGEKIEKHPYERSGLGVDVRPGEEATVPLNITAPAAPGEYTLQIDLVQEMVAWFAEKGSTPQKFKVTVGN